MSRLAGHDEYSSLYSRALELAPSVDPEELRRCFRFVPGREAEEEGLWRPLPEGELVRGEGHDPIPIPGGLHLSAVTVTHEQLWRMDPAFESHWVRGGLGQPKTDLGVDPADELGRLPATNIRHYEAEYFARWLTRQLQRPVDGKAWEGEARLPTEWEWEYACRLVRKPAGRLVPASTRFWCGENEADLQEVAWFDANSAGHPHPVARKKANGAGLYDVHGNTWEWTASWFDVALRVLRGGSYHVSAELCASAFRNWLLPGNAVRSVGFRLLLSAPPPAWLIEPRT